MEESSVGGVPWNFRHAVRRSSRCSCCGRLTPIAEQTLFAATVYDRRRHFFWACRACRGGRERLKWLESKSRARLSSRLQRQGFGHGVERAAICRRLGLECES